MSNPGILNSLFNFNTPVTPNTLNYAQQLQQAQHQQALAEQLRQQAGQAIPVQSGGGQPAPISWGSVLAKGLQGLSAGTKEYAANQAMQQASQQDTDASRQMMQSLMPQNQAGIPGLPAITSQLNATAPQLPGQGAPPGAGMGPPPPQPAPVSAPVTDPGMAGTPMQSVMPSTNQQMMALFGGGTGPQATAMRQAMLPGLQQQQLADIQRQRVQTSLMGANAPPGVDPATWQRMVATDPAGAHDLQQKALDAQITSGVHQKTPEETYIAQQVNQGVDPLEAHRKWAQAGALYIQAQQNYRAQLRSSQYNLSDDENNALFGPGGAVESGALNGDHINSRNAHIYAKAFISNPSLNVNNSAGIAAMMKNPTFQNRVMVADSLPALIDNVTQAGKKVDFSDINYVGKLQAWQKGQLNDPDFINYMGQRNDAMMNIASVMRGVGMSDKAIDTEMEAAPLTMSPKAWDAWAAGQNTSLAPRLRQYAPYTLHPAGGAAAPVIVAPGKAAPVAVAEPAVAAPAGVDANTWKYMTPQERALWPK